MKSEVTQSACGPFTKSKERMQKFKETGDSSCIIKLNWIKHVVSMKWLQEISKVQLEELLLAEVFCDKAFNIPNNSQQDEYQREPLSLVHKCFDKKSKKSSAAMHVDTPNQGLADELHKLISIIMAYLKWHTFKQAIAYFSVGHSIII